MENRISAQSIFSRGGGGIGFAGPRGSIREPSNYAAVEYSSQHPHLSAALPVICIFLALPPPLRLRVISFYHFFFYSHFSSSFRNVIYLAVFTHASLSIRSTNYVLLIFCCPDGRRVRFCHTFWDISRGGKKKT